MQQTSRRRRWRRTAGWILAGLVAVVSVAPLLLASHGLAKTPSIVDNPVAEIFDARKSQQTRANKTTAKPQHDGMMSTSSVICLMYKDDNDIVHEWIAYHYHVLRMRTLVVAVDPESQSRPPFDIWRQNFDLDIVEWKNDTFMPDWFQAGDFSQLPSYIPDQVMEKPLEHAWFSHLTAEDLVQDPGLLNRTFAKINKHRFRQVTFLSQCTLYLKRHKKATTTWMAHVDTDEYIVPNPLVFGTNRLGGIQPQRPSPGSVVQYLEKVFLHYPKRLSRLCVMMPVLLFGAMDEKGSLHGTYQDYEQNASRRIAFPRGFALDKFETSRWRYHADYNDTINGMQKAILDVSRLSMKDDLLASGKAFSVHQPSKQSCRRYTRFPETSAVRLHPLVVYHYVGSYERYLARPGDVRRRNPLAYKAKAAVHAVRDHGWITGWLQSFVDTHGQEKASMVLSSYKLRSSLSIVS